MPDRAGGNDPDPEELDRRRRELNKEIGTPKTRELTPLERLVAARQVEKRAQRRRDTRTLGNVAAGQRITLRSRHPANGRLMTVKPTITVAEPGIELRWASSLPGLISGEHRFTLSAIDGGTRLVQAETFRGLLARFSGRTFANAEGSFRALNEALKERAEARADRPAGPAS